MNNLLIKLAKAKRMWQRTGFLGGVNILSSYLTTFTKAFFVGSGDVLFVTSGVGDSAVYRAYNTAEELRLHGFKAKTTITDNPRLEKLASKFEIFIFHRVVVDEKIKNFIEIIKKLEKEIIFETDDLVHDPKYLIHMDYFKNMSTSEQEVYKKGIGTEIIDDPYVKVCTTTVSFLANILAQKNKRVIIVPNKFSQKELEIANKVLKNKKPQGDFVRIVYCSGTLSHNKDFATIKDALLQIVRKYPLVKLKFVGPLDLPDEFAKLKEKVEVVPRVPRSAIYEQIHQADINLAPLEIDNPFCESKSEIKFTEAGAVEVPTVAVRNQTFSEAIDDGVDGFLAETIDEWVEKLSALIDNEKLRKEMGKSAREKTLRDYTNKNSSNDEYYDYISSKLN